MNAAPRVEGAFQGIPSTGAIAHDEPLHLVSGVYELRQGTAASKFKVVGVGADGQNSARLAGRGSPGAQGRQSNAQGREPAKGEREVGSPPQLGRIEENAGQICHQQR